MDGLGDTTVDIFAPPPASPSPSSMLSLPRNLDAIGTTAAKIVQGAELYYGTQAQIAQLKYGAQIAKASGQSAVAAARAGGQASAIQAGYTLPSPSLLMVGGLALAALLILKR